jgi:methylated-DNA-protein-cysteine methyltransferase-like protein
MFMKNYPELYLTIWKAVRGVRKGRVATYGQIARICGLRGHARLVGYALHNLPPNSGIPWHRIINSKGMISLPRHTGGYERQKKLLEQEGIVFRNEKVDLAKHGAENRPKENSGKAHSAKRTPIGRKKRKSAWID